MIILVNYIYYGQALKIYVIQYNSDLLMYELEIHVHGLTYCCTLSTLNVQLKSQKVDKR